MVVAYQVSSEKFREEFTSSLYNLKTHVAFIKSENNFKDKDIFHIKARNTFKRKNSQDKFVFVDVHNSRRG